MTSRVLRNSQRLDSEAQFKRNLLERFFVRFHMTLALSGVCVSGLLVSKLLLELGMRSMLERYLVAVCISYLIFFLLIRIWLWYISRSSQREHVLPDIDVGDAIDLGRVSVDTLRASTGGGTTVDAPFGGGSGEFGGGGATDSWGDTPGASVSVHSSSTHSALSGHGGSSGGSDGGFDLDGEAIVLVALVLLLTAIFGAGVYLVYAAPDILSEAAFQALLATGLIKASKTVTRGAWTGSVLRATCIPFLIVLLMTGVFGWIAHKYYPQATRVAEIFQRPTATESR